MYLISKELENKFGAESYFLCHLPRNKRFLINNGVGADRLYDMFYSGFVKPDFEFLKQSEQKYDFRIWDFWSITSTRKKSRSRLSNDQVFGKFEYVIRQTEKLFDEIKPDYLVLYGPAGFSDALIYTIAKVKGCKVIELTSARILGKFAINDNLHNSWPILKLEYDKIKNQTNPNLETANSFIDNYFKSPAKQDCTINYKQSFGKRLKTIIKYAGYLIKSRKLPDFTLTVAPVVLWPIKQTFFRMLRIFEYPIPNEKFVFFPLHFQPEASTLIYGKWYVDQLALIESLSKSIPISHMLYLKEHSFGYGNRQLSFYKRLKALPNVRIISPYADNLKLIKECSLLVTITGTSGWEALLCQKPVIVFGDVFYNICEEVIKIKSVEDLPIIINENIDRNKSKVNLAKFVEAVLRSTYEGLARLPPDCNGYSLNEDNIKLLSAGIVDYIQKMG